MRPPYACHQRVQYIDLAELVRGPGETVSKNHDRSNNDHSLHTCSVPALMGTSFFKNTNGRQRIKGHIIARPNESETGKIALTREIIDRLHGGGSIFMTSVHPRPGLEKAH